MTLRRRHENPGEVNKLSLFQVRWDGDVIGVTRTVEPVGESEHW